MARTVSGRSSECEGGTEGAERKGCEGLEGLGDSEFLPCLRTAET
jgi:hypothetical protein